MNKTRRLKRIISLVERGGVIMDNMYATYNLKEIRSIVNQAVEFEMWEKRDNEKNWDVIQDLKVRLFDMFGIEA